MLRAWDKNEGAKIEMQLSLYTASRHGHKGRRSHILGKITLTLVSISRPMGKQ